MAALVNGVLETEDATSVWSSATPITRFLLKVSEIQKRKAAEAGLTLRKVLDLGRGVSLQLIYIPSGSFMMGSSASEDG